jgi:NADH dehydrogenase
MNKVHNQETIVILGAGFAGIRCAVDLYDRTKHKDDVKIILIDKSPYQSFYPSLYEVAAAHMPKEANCLPIRQVIGKRSIHFLQDIVDQIDPVNQQIHLHRHNTVRYDYLVLALGSVPNDYHIPGLADYAHCFNGFDTALQVRRHVESALRTQEDVRLVIGGAGPTGVELAAAFRYFAEDFCRHRNNHQQHLSVELIELSGHPLTGFPSKMAKLTDRYLRKLGVKPYYNVGIAKVTDKTITLTDKSQIPYDVLVWTGGIKPNPVIRHETFEYDNRGRILTNKYLQAKGFSRIFVIGDIASVATGRKSTLPQVAPHAYSEGAHVARNLTRILNEQDLIAYEPDNAPTVIPLGAEYGLFRWRNQVWAGKWVMLLKRLIEWRYLAGIMPLSIAWKMAIDGEHHRHETDFFDQAEV